MNNCILEQKKKKKNKIILVISQFMLLLGIVILWESLAYFDIIDTFIFSSPSRIINILIKYISTGEIW